MRRALKDESRRIQYKQILAERSREVSKFAKTRSEFTIAAKRHAFLNRLLGSVQAGFARRQLLEFCTANRYALNPRGAANALAGSPMIGYRQSAKRCSNFTKETGGLRYRVFQAIEHIVRACGSEDDFAERARVWLEKRHSSKSQGVLELQRNWWHFRSAIETVLQEKNYTQEHLPYILLNRYFRNADSALELDRTLANRAGIARFAIK